MGSEYRPSGAMSAAENVGKGEDVERLLQQLDELERAGDDFFTRMCVQ